MQESLDVASLEFAPVTVLPPIRYRTYVAAPVEEVFNAAATADGWNAWFTTAAHIDQAAGGHYFFRWVDFGADLVNLEISGRVLAYEPPTRFQFEWPSGADLTTVSLEIEPHGEGAILTVHEVGYTGSRQQMEACLDCACGWGEALTLLKFFIEQGATYTPPSPPSEMS